VFSVPATYDSKLVKHSSLVTLNTRNNYWSAWFEQGSHFETFCMANICPLVEHYLEQHSIKNGLIY